MTQPQLYEHAMRFLRETDGLLPAEGNSELFFRAWQRVSMSLQKLLRERIPEMALRDLRKAQDRDVGRSLVVYSAARVYYGRPCTEFTYDVADPRTLEHALRLCGRGTLLALAPLEKRLDEAGERLLARRYAPAWYQDVIAAVRHKPRLLLKLIACESKVIDAVIVLGTVRTPSAAKRYAVAAGAALRHICETDMSELAIPVLDDASLVLSTRASAPLAIDQSALAS
jgi:hypothetical protein